MVLKEKSDRLRGWVSYTQKVEGTSRYLPIELGYGHEYWVDESRPVEDQDAEEWEKLRQRALKQLKDSGLI